MIHLSDEDILQLAEITEENLILSKKQLEMMNHLKSCEACYVKFCGAIALLEVTGDSGSVYLSKIFDVQGAENPQAQSPAKTMAIVNLIRQVVHGKIEMILEQASVAGDAFSFQPSVTMATRSVATDRSGVYKVEDVDDEKTFIAIDSERKELLLQISAKKLHNSGIKAYLLLETGKKTEIQIEKKGVIYIGRVNNLPNDGGVIVIQESY